MKAAAHRMENEAQVMSNALKKPEHPLPPEMLDMKMTMMRETEVEMEMEVKLLPEMTMLPSTDWSVFI